VVRDRSPATFAELRAGRVGVTKAHRLAAEPPLTNGESMSFDNGSLPAVHGDYRAGLPDNYDPERGLKSVLVAETAEKHYKRAKDSTGLYQAVQVKLGEQRRFVLWWDGQGKRKATPGNLGPSQNADGPAAADFGLNRETLSRWRKKLKDPRKFDDTLEAAAERCRRVCEAEKGSTDQKGASGTGENEWYTPPEFVEAARAVMGGIDLDPASSAKAQEVVRAGRYFTRDEDGLAHPWHGRVWLNPPYAQPHINDFAEKMAEEWRTGRVASAVMLTHNYTDAGWFHALAAEATAICFKRGRVKFYSPSGELASPTQGQAFFYFGPDPAAFHAEFSQIGFVAEVIRDA
jgi:phage N-6-adenine-methyltransferase